MKTFIFFAVSILGSISFATSFAALPERAISGSPPNVLCRFAFYENKWHVLPAFVPAYSIGDKKMLGNVFATYSDPVAPGFGICTTRDRDQAGRLVAFKMFTYAFENEFRAAPGTCEIFTEGSYRIVEQRKVAPVQRQVSTSLTMQRPDGTKLTYINYFVSAEEETAWAEEPKLAAKKCHELWTSSQGG